MKFTGYSFIVCGSSKITELHLKTIVKIKNCTLEYIYAEDKIRRDYLSKKYKIPICENLRNPILKKCNVALITSKTSKHFNLIISLSKYINNFIIEKPIVGSLQELKKIKKYFNYKKIKFLEVSQYLYTPKIKKIKFPEKSITIIIRKKRDINYYKDYNNNFDINKSVAISQFPHWLDLANFFSSGRLFINKIVSEKSNLKMPFKDKFNVFLKDRKFNNIKYKINLNCGKNKNYATRLIVDNKSITLEENIFLKFFKKFTVMFTGSKFFTSFQEEAFLNMYLSFIERLGNKKVYSPNIFLKKIAMLEKIKKYL